MGCILMSNVGLYIEYVDLYHKVFLYGQVNFVIFRKRVWHLCSTNEMPKWQIGREKLVIQMNKCNKKIAHMYRWKIYCDTHQELNQFCQGFILKYRGNSHDCYMYQA